MGCRDMYILLYGLQFKAGAGGGFYRKVADKAIGLG